MYDIDPIKKVESPIKLGTTFTTDSIYQNGEKGKKITEIQKNFQCSGTELFYQNKKEAGQWFQALSAQMPLLGGNKSGFIRSITQEESEVKSFVSDLDKVQYQLRREDINRLNILEELKPMRKSIGFFCCLKFRGIIIS